MSYHVPVTGLVVILTLSFNNYITILNTKQDRRYIREPEGCLFKDCSHLAIMQDVNLIGEKCHKMVNQR